MTGKILGMKNILLPIELCQLMCAFLGVTKAQCSFTIRNFLHESSHQITIKKKDLNKNKIKSDCDLIRTIKTDIQRETWHIFLIHFYQVYLNV